MSPPTCREVVGLLRFALHLNSIKFALRNILCIGTASSMADNTANSVNVDGEPKAQKKQVCRFFATKGMYLRGKYVSPPREALRPTRHHENCQFVNVLTPYCRLPGRRRLSVCPPYRPRWTIFSAKTGSTRWQQAQCASKPTTETVPSATCR